MESLGNNLSDLMILSTASGFKHWFAASASPSRNLRIRGLGYREAMPPGLIDRPRGTGDFLLMWFHDASWIGNQLHAGSRHQANTLMLWPPGERQFYGHPTAGYRHSWLHFHGAPAPELIRKNRMPLSRPIRMSDAADFEHSLLELHRELAAFSRPDPVIVQNLLVNTFRTIRRSRENVPPQPRIADNLLRVRNFIQTIPARRVALSELAAMSGWSVPHFCARFKEAFGMPPMDCLLRNRLNHAALLLRNRNLNISEIAALTGYDDPFHFSKMFRRQFGCSPRTHRARTSGE